MGVSIDTSQLEIVKTFSGFLQIMQEPDKYKDLLKETDRLIKEQRDLLGPCQTKEAADAYYAKAQATAAKWAEDADAKEQAWLATVDQQKEDFAKKKASVALALSDAKAVRDEADKYLKAAQVANDEALRKLAVADGTKAEVEALLKSAQEKDAELTEKVAKVKQMLGE